MSVPTVTARNRRSAVDRLMRSTAFRRAREAAALTLDDAHALEQLVQHVSARDFHQGALRPMSGHIEAALGLLRQRIGYLTSGECAPELTAAQAARYRLIVAALCYLARGSDVIPDHHTHGDIDDAVVAREVLSTAEHELLPFFPGLVEYKTPSGPVLPPSADRDASPGWRVVRGSRLVRH